MTVTLCSSFNFRKCLAFMFRLLFGIIISRPIESKMYRDTHHVFLELESL
jgi:hypothetical protein